MMCKLKSSVYILLFLSFVYTNSGQEDLTMKENTYGELVVDTVVNVIREACILQDHLFLKRVALYETNYGMTFQTGFNGGIWKVDERMFNLTKSRATNLKNAYDRIRSELSIDWLNVKWQDLKKPLLSGLAASLYLQAQTNEPIPLGQLHQAIYWQKYYRSNGDADQFYMTIQTMMTNEGCRVADQADLVFLIEDSSDITDTDFAEIKTFLNNVIDALHIGSDLTRIGLVTFSDQPKIRLLLKNGLSKSTITSEINKLSKSAGIGVSVGTQQALNVIESDMFSAHNGARRGVAHIAVLITKRHTINQAQSQYGASMLKASGVRLVVLGVGNRVDEHHLQTIASSPSCENYRHLASFQDMSSFENEMEELVCQVPAVLNTGMYTYPCKVDPLLVVPDNPYGTLITVSVTNDKRVVYGSSKYSLPGVPLHEYSGEATLQTPLTIYLRNNSDFYLSVQKSIASSCTGTFTINVGVGATSTNQNTQMICIENGVQRNCTKQDIAKNQHSLVSYKNSSLPNICVSNITIAPHPSDVTKFLMCDRQGQLLSVQCPPNERFCVQSQLCQNACSLAFSQQPLVLSTSSKQRPPTTPTHATTTTTKNFRSVTSSISSPIVLVYNGGMTTSNTITNTPNYLMASSLIPITGAPIIITPPPGIFQTLPPHTPSHTTYNHIVATLTPNYLSSTKRVTSAATTPSMPSNNCQTNPCTLSALMTGLMYFPACDEHEYLHCTELGNYVKVTCPPDQIFNPSIAICVNEYVMDDATKQFIRNIPNPCKGVSGDRYFSHPSDKTKFIHCDGYWNGFMESCPMGEMYNLLTQSCVGSLPVG